MTGKIHAERPYFTSFLITFLLVLPILSVFRIYFQFNDDYWAQFILKGIVLDWAPSEFNQMENVLLCLGLKSLYSHFGQIQWYASFFVLTQILSIWAILAALQLGSSKLFKTLLFILGSWVLAIHFFDCLQWTVVAALAGIGAILLLAALWKRGDGKHLPMGLVLSFILIMISVLIRYKSFLLMSLVFFPSAVFLGWKVKLNPVRWTILGFLVVMAGLSCAAVLFDKAYYSSDPAWKAATEVKTQYENLTDLRNPIYDETTKPFFDSIGWSVIDFALLKRTYYWDPDTYSAEKLKLICDHFPQWAAGKDAQDTFGDMFLNLHAQLCFLFFLVLLPFLLEEWKWALVIGLWTAAVLIFCQFYLKMPERIFLPCLYLQIILAIFFLASKPGREILSLKALFKNNTWGTIGLTLMLFLSFIAFHFEYDQNRLCAFRTRLVKASVLSLNPTDQQLFVTWGSVFPYEQIDAFDEDYLEHFHAVSLAWFQRSPTTQAMLARFGLQSPLKDIVDKPNVYLVCSQDHFQLFDHHLLERYKMEIEGKAAFQSAGFTTYSIQQLKGRTAKR